MHSLKGRIFSEPISNVKCKKYNQYSQSDFSQLEIMALSEVAIFAWKMRTVLNRMKNQFSDFSHFYFLSYGWLYLRFTDDTPYFPSVSPTKKNYENVAAIKMRNKLKLMKTLIFLFLIFLFFELWSIFYSKFIENLQILSSKITTSYKLKIGKLTYH